MSRQVIGGKNVPYVVGLLTWALSILFKKFQKKFLFENILQRTAGKSCHILLFSTSACRILDFLLPVEFKLNSFTAVPLKRYLKGHRNTQQALYRSFLHTRYSYSCFSSYNYLGSYN